MIIFENDVHCVLSYVVMENVIFPTIPIFLGCFSVSNVVFFKVMIECAFVSFFYFLLRGILYKWINYKSKCSFLF